MVAEKHQKENVDWAAEVELDSKYSHMITELRYNPGMGYMAYGKTYDMCCS